MKRSEMLNVIAATVNDYDGYPPAYKILDAIEEAGMLPPKSLIKDSHEDDCQSYDGDDCSCSGIEDNKWDEDE